MKKPTKVKKLVVTDNDPYFFRDQEMFRSNMEETENDPYVIGKNQQASNYKV